MGLEIGVTVFVVVMVVRTLQPQFSPSAEHQKAGTAEFNLATLRAAIESYRAEHDGRCPPADASTGTILGLPLDQMPENPFTGSRVVRVTQQDRPAVTVAAAHGGWLYNDSTGQIWLDSDPGNEW
jgi:type II secretory pathway pseudopilin PulG